MNSILKEQESVTNQMQNFINLKTMLNLNESENDILDSLQKECTLLLNQNYSYLIALYQYISIIPVAIKYKINTVSLLDDEVSLYNDLKALSDLFKTDPLFPIFVNSLLEFTIKNIVGDKNQLILDDELIKEYKEYKITTNLMLYHIINSSTSKINIYDSSNVIFNLFLLYSWQLKNIHKPIDDLNEDESTVLAALIIGIEPEEIVHLGLCKSIEKVNTQITNIPAKFHVDNITQAIFRIILINPSIWIENDLNSMIKSIKNIKLFL